MSSLPAELPRALVERDGAILIITLNRPDQKNAISDIIADAADHHLDADPPASVAPSPERTARSARGWISSDSPPTSTRRCRAAPSAA